MDDLRSIEPVGGEWRFEMLGHLKGMLGPMSMCCLVVAAAAPARAEGRTPVFGDGFDTAGLLVENFKLTPSDAWRVDGGRLVANAPGAATAVLKQEIPVECKVSVEVTSLELRNDYAGVTLHGISFLLRHDERHIYKVKINEG